MRRCGRRSPAVHTTRPRRPARPPPPLPPSPAPQAALRPPRDLAASAPPSSGQAPSAERPPALNSWRRFSHQCASGPVWPPPASFFRRARFPRSFGLPHRRPPPLRRRDDARPSRGDSGGASSWRHSQAPAPLPPCPSPQTPSVSSALPSSGGRCTLADYHLRRGDRRPPCCSAEPRRIHGGGEARGTRWKRERLSAPDRPLGHRPP
jgi:hypothetical protein